MRLIQRSLGRMRKVIAPAQEDHSEGKRGPRKTVIFLAQGLLAM
jgi:hypothetical protein